MFLGDSNGFVGIERFAGEDVQVGIAVVITEVSGNSGSLDELNQGITGSMGQMLGEMLEDGFSVSHHVNGLEEFCHIGLYRACVGNVGIAAGKI